MRGREAVGQDASHHTANVRRKAEQRPTVSERTAYRIWKGYRYFPSPKIKHDGLKLASRIHAQTHTHTHTQSCSVELFAKCSGTYTTDLKTREENKTFL